MSVSSSGLKTYSCIKLRKQIVKLTKIHVQICRYTFCLSMDPQLFAATRAVWTWAKLFAYFFTERVVDQTDHGSQKRRNVGWKFIADVIFA